MKCLRKTNLRSFAKVLNYLVLVLILSPVIAWAQVSVDSLLQRSQAQQLWRHPQWLKLGHYREGLVGQVYSPLKGDFFLAANGRKDPQSELNATIATLFGSPQGPALQCRYLARTKWLSQVLEIPSAQLAPCPQRDEWKAKLAAKEIYLIFASSDLSSAGSSFGHTFLRLHNPENKNEKVLLDYGVNFAAATGEDSGALYALKGIFGYYPGVYSMLPYHQKIREYSNVEGRNIWEYKLDFESAEVERLIDHLLELEGSYSDYYFSNDNCSQQILELLEVARPQLKVADKFKDMTIPLDTVKILATQGLLVSQEMRPSLSGQWEALFAKLNPSQQEFVVATIKNQEIAVELSAQAKAESLDAALSYLALEEYKTGQDFRSKKYKLAVERAALGGKTAPVEVEKTKSPLFSPDTVAWYIGGGQIQDQSFYRFKYRRAFHDLLSDDSGLAPFSHLELLGADVRYFPENRNWDLYQLTLLKILSTYPMNRFDKSVSWTVDLGTQPKFAPYLHLGVGGAIDLKKDHRLLMMVISENTNLHETAQSSAGLELRWLSRSEFIRTELGTKYMYDLKETDLFASPFVGLSYGDGKSEIRLENQWKRGQPEWLLSLIF